MTLLYRRWLPLIILCSIVLALLVADAIAFLYSYLAYVGYLYVGLLTLLVIPLLVTSLVSATAELGPGKRITSLLLRLLGYFAVTGLMAIIIGFGVGSLFAGSVDVTKISHATPRAEIAADRSDIGGRFGAYLPIDPERPETTGTLFVFVVVMMLFGAVLGTMQQRSRTVTEITRTVRDVFQKLTGYFLYAAPLGFFALVAANKLHADSAMPSSANESLYYLLAILVGMIIHLLLILPGIYWLVTRNTPVSFFANMGSAFVTALGSGSAVLAFPVAQTDLAEKNKIDQRASGMVLPLGMTINRNGTALLLAASIVFVAHLVGVDLSLTQYLLAAFVVLLLSFVGPLFIGAEMLLIMPVALAIGLPTMGSSMAMMYLAPLGWLIWRLSAAVDIGGDIVGAVVVQYKLRPSSSSASVSRPQPSRQERPQRRPQGSHQQRRSQGDRPLRQDRSGPRRRDSDRPRRSERPNRPPRSSEQSRPDNRRFDRRSEHRDNRNRQQGTPSSPRREPMETKDESPKPMEIQIEEQRNELEEAIKATRKEVVTVDEKNRPVEKRPVENQRQPELPNEEESTNEAVSYGRARARRGRVTPRDPSDQEKDLQQPESDSKESSSSSESGEQQEVSYGRNRRKREPR